MHTLLPSELTDGPRNVFRRGLASLLVSTPSAGTLVAMVPGPHSTAAQGKWTALANQPTFNTDTALLLTDGRVMVHEYGDPRHNGQGANNWWALTPDINGSYQNGTW